ncbi:hypothetical protein [Pedobacter cryoconitis]|uniref:Lipoprotein n=1 Tax=Pedobacter cryoconitis TaxID=188932 RepID=A0A7X0J2C2_9SPHI|nr:hypothetical protein [Pedobacter cryoconitis]MBB6499791.1 hypothetical protein [Pedobacter cryoconitis]
MRAKLILFILPVLAFTSCAKHQSGSPGESAVPKELVIKYEVECNNCQVKYSTSNDKDEQTTVVGKWLQEVKAMDLDTARLAISVSGPLQNVKSVISVGDQSISKKSAPQKDDTSIHFVDLSLYKK